jgi:hypothetical protein
MARNWNTNATEAYRYDPIFWPALLLPLHTVDRLLMWGRVLAHCSPYLTRV